MKFFQNILIIVVVVTIIFLIKKLMVTKKLEKKENKKLENKNLSIYELIKSSIQSDGSLPENFSLLQEETDGIPWADGAMDGVFLYHTDTNEENIETLKNIVFQISEGKFKEAQNNLLIWVQSLMSQGYTIHDIKSMRLSDFDLMVQALETKESQEEEETTLDKAFPFLFG